MRAPSLDDMDRFVRSVSGRSFNTPLGLLAAPTPKGWFLDTEDAIIGVGDAAFDAARTALHHGELMELDWFRLHRPDTTLIEPGEVVAYAVRLGGLWMKLACRVVSVFDETDRDGSRRAGFVYATLVGHAARGEEQFMVYRNGSNGEVHGEIRAVSQPARWFAWLGLPVVRHAQRRFKPEALAALAGAVRRRAGIQPRSTSPR